MKKILFIMPSLFIGGAERSLLSLLNMIDYSAYDVSLFLYRHEGEFLQYLPSKVNMIPPIEEYATFDVPIKHLLLSKKWRFGLARIWSKIAMKAHCIKTQEKPGVWMAMQYISKSLLPLLRNIPGEYDVAISFLGIPDVLVEKAKAKKKIAWNHTDYTILNPNKNRDREIYSKIDYIVSVSAPCTAQFLKVYPEFSDKAITIENLLSIDFLEQQVSEPVTDMERKGHEFVLLSVGRYSDAKNFDNIPEICKRIRENGKDVIWYIVGYGSDESLIREKIQNAGMEDYVILLGKKSNPYPYIKNCDVYVQPSRYEGKAVTVREAQALHKPVVITRFATSSSQLVDGYDGVIVPMDNEGCARGITQLLDDKKQMNRLSDNTYHVDYSNKSQLDKLYQIIGCEDLLWQR